MKKFWENCEKVEDVSGRRKIITIQAKNGEYFSLPPPFLIYGPKITPDFEVFEIV